MKSKKVVDKMTNALMKQENAVSFSNDFFVRFMDYAQVKDTTLQGYKVCIRQFIKYLQENNIQTPTRDTIKDYVRYIDRQNFTSGTRHQYLRAVKHFFKWLASEGLYPNIADNIKGAKVNTDNTKKEAFTETDIKTILQGIDRSTPQGKRNYAMILLAVTGGLRIIELQRADIQDIQTIRGQSVIYIQGKGRDAKDEYIKLIDEVKEAIDDYLQTRKNRQPNAPLFTGTSNRAKDERITETSISRLIKSVFKQCGYDSNKLTAHSLRHTSNTLLFKAGADIYKVQKHARHKDPKTTEIYLHIADRDNDTSEKDIYNQIFNTKTQDTRKNIIAILDVLNNDQQNKVLKFMQKMATT